MGTRHDEERDTAAAAAVAAAASLGLAACGGGGTSGSSSPANSSPGSASTGFNAACHERSFNPSDKKGGTLRIGDLRRLGLPRPRRHVLRLRRGTSPRSTAAPLMMFKPAPGAGGHQARPRPRREPRQPSDGGKTWTYKLRTGLKYEDGTPITSKDVKYAVARSLDKDVSRTARRTSTTSSTCRATRVPTRTRTRRRPQGHRDAGRPDDRLPPEEAVRRLRLLRPAAVDVAGAGGQGHRRRSTRSTSSPPARTSSRPTSRASSSTLVRNPNWDPATDPTRKALPDKIDVAAEVERRTTSTTGCWPATSTSTSRAPASRPPTQGKILADPQLEGATRTTRSVARLGTLSINGDVAPLEQHRSAARPSSTRPTRRRLPARLRRRHRRRRSRPTCMPPNDPGLPSSSTSTRPAGQHG